MKTEEKLTEIQKMGYHVGRPNIPDKEAVLGRIEEVLDNKWLTNMGPLSLELEEKIACLLNVKHCICVCNGTIGLELLHRALDLTGEVIIPAFSFIATAHSLMWQNINPVFCDVGLDNHLINPDLVESLITPRTSAILAVPIWGQFCDYGALEKISSKHGLKLIYDSAHAFGCKYNGKYLGGNGDAEVFSFHATKIFSTGEGGAITTNCDHLAEKLRRMRNFGFSAQDKVSQLGTNAKMNELCAAYGLASLDQVADLITYNRQVYSMYMELFDDFRFMKIMRMNNQEENSNHYIIARAESNLRDPILEAFHEIGIFVKKYFYPGLHKHSPYCNIKGLEKRLVNTEKLCGEILCFPTGRQIDESVIHQMHDVLNKF
jgi:dTDP-4-amino-4,6-dideoxygalactose transaminase